MKAAIHSSLALLGGLFLLGSAPRASYAAPAAADSASMHGHGRQHGAHPQTPARKRSPPSRHTRRATAAPHAVHHEEHTPSHPLGYGGREASGTSWLPDRTPVRHWMAPLGSWNTMVHGTAYLGYDRMNGPRGADRVFAPNMFMVMADRSAGPRTRWRIAGMFSTDAITVGGQGYPLLFQSGETWDGQPLRDHQHPHNVFSELSASVVKAVSKSLAFHVYLAPVGEPALGPPAYVHRPVADHNPLAPIGHHWQDATHIAYGVATAGLQTRKIQVEGSLFNGREPGENRAEILGPKFDSGSGRLSWNPTSSLAFQVSHGYLHEPEALHPGEDTWRTTSSVSWVQAQEAGRQADLTLVWGRNRQHGRDFDSWLLEGEWAAEQGLTPFARIEQVDKSAEELVLPPGFPEDQAFRLRQLTLGAAHALPLNGPLSWSLGAQAVASFVPRALRDVYGEDSMGWVAFVRIRPATPREGAGMEH